MAIAAVIRFIIATPDSLNDNRGSPAVNELANFNSFVRFYDPSHHHSELGAQLNSTLISINAPIRIGHATVMPGDVVLGRDGGVIFVPPQLAERSPESAGECSAGSVTLSPVRQHEERIGSMGGGMSQPDQ
jgi:hypothetical protein